MLHRVRAPALALAAALYLTPLVPASAQEQSVSAADVEPPPVIPTSAFAAASPFTAAVRLSPDGNRIAFSQKRDGAVYIGTYSVVDDRVERRFPLPDTGELQWLRWAGSHRLLMSFAWQTEVLGLPFRSTRLFVIDINGSEARYVGNKNQGIWGDDVVYVDPTGEFVLLAMQRDVFSEPEVWRMPLGPGDRQGEKIESRRGVWEWIADDKGIVRVGLGIEGNRLKVWYRKEAGEKFRVVARLREDDKEELWDLIRLISGSDEGFVIEPGESGRLALRHFNYATREVGGVVYENPDWDVEDVTLDKEGQPLSIRFTDDRPQIVWFDEKLASLQPRLEKALNAEAVEILDRADDDSRLLLLKRGASDPGALYFYTPAIRNLVEFSQLRPDLDPAQLSPVRPVSYAARDGTQIRAYLTLPKGRQASGLPLIVLPHGGPYGVRDTLEYSDEVQLLANRGYAVIQPNYRGSGGYGDAFDELGKGEIGRKMQDDLDDAVDWAVAEGIADAKRVCLVGSSYGGYAALWGAIRNPDRYRCAASFAGVTDWDKQLSYDARSLSRAGSRSWRERIRGAERETELDTVAPARQAVRLTRPILVVHGKKDTNVPFSQFELMRNASRKAGNADAEFLELPESGHGFASPADEQAWYDALVNFLAKHNPAD